MRNTLSHQAPHPTPRHPCVTPSTPHNGRVTVDLLAVLRAGTSRFIDPVTHVQVLPARAGVTASWPDWTPPALREALTRQGISAPWEHQAAAAEHAHAGRHVVISTGTASGKSLAFQLPALSALLTDERACVLYLSPTKALTADQFGTLESLALPGIRPAVYDGDTPADERDWVREHARFILTNPDMLHRGILGSAHRWTRVLRRLSMVIVDEAHSYRGVFGSHVALVLRRLRRLAAQHGSAPTFVLASATMADPARSAQLLIGADVQAVTEDAAPRPQRTFVLWEPMAEPDEVDPDDGSSEHQRSARPSATSESARMLADLAAAGARTIAFVRSRAGTEQVALAARRRLQHSAPELVDQVAAYRGGYLPEDRRYLEAALDSGTLLGLASTSALELGIDIAGLDAVLVAGFPGTLASLWQQAGRAGRTTDGGRPQPLVAFIARDDPLDTYLVRHPAAIFDRAVESAVIDPANPQLLGPHLRCAAAELRLTEEDLPLFGDIGHVRSVLTDLVQRKQLRARQQGWYFVEAGHPAGEVDLRGGGGREVLIVESETARMLGTVDRGRAGSVVHTGAVYVHRGDTFVVEELDLDEDVAYVRADRPDYWTSTLSMSTIELLATEDERRLGELTIAHGPVRVTEQVLAYQRRRHRGELIDTEPLELPEQTLDTRAVWYTLTGEFLARNGLDEAAIPGALHAAEHAAIGLLPLFAGCDRWDIGGLSTAGHPDTGLPTVIVYDGFAGGAGFADRGFSVFTDWLTATRDLVSHCPCQSGCPSCVQSPKCGNGNHPLFKSGAAALLGALVDRLLTD